jgi:GDP/UDP-N,N'-diacetylbacillosamine 2-epimerase (hydrolysing)
MESTLRLLAGSHGVSLGIAVTGMHLDPLHGATVREVEASGLRIDRRVPAPSLDGTGAGMAKALAEMTSGLVDAWSASKPDLVLLVGDRGEMLAAALAAAHLDVPIAHVHGGERSGTIDESIRHAVSKFAHLHMVATEASRDRLVCMGERPDRIWVTGAPGLDGLGELATERRAELCAAFALDPTRPLALMSYHPVLQDGADAAAPAAALLDAAREAGLQVVALAPNSDAGSREVRSALERAEGRGEICLAVHLPRRRFVSLMACADLMVGNSSAGIIEAATFGTPVVNVGDRQAMRERSTNVLDAGTDTASIRGCIYRALASGRGPCVNAYGDGAAGPRIVEILRLADLGRQLTRKSNAY